MRHYLGIDIGTFESKGVLVDAEGRIVASAARPHKMLVPQPGWAEHRPREDWWGDFCFLSNKLIADSGVAPADIVAVAASAIGPCMLPVDAEGEPLMNGVLYGVDTRAAREIEELTARIGEDVLLSRCGNALTSQSIGPKILWLKRNRPELYAKTARILTSTTYIVHKLTGRYVIDHYSAANFSPLYDVEKLEWTDELADDIIGLDKLPEAIWTTDIAGTVTAEAAAETGLAVGTPVTTGTIDAGAEALSVGVLDDGDMLLMYGSTIFIIEITPVRVPDARLWYAPWFFPGKHAAMSGLATSGTLSHWFREQFGKELDPATAVMALALEAEGSPPGANGLVMLPYFSGERTPIHDTEAKGVLFGMNLTHSRGDIYRALFEGIAFGTHHVFETYADVGQPPKAILAAGGGTKNKVWSQATSDVSGRTQIVRQKTVGASYGDAFIAALAIGDVQPDDIRSWNPVDHEITPDENLRELYERRYRVFRELYERNKDLMREL
ncbi:MAG TPA: FGGY-family carbohydrate kinase [Devosia sp.]|jgi:xylulokinase|uniref:FGGY-family carbohydrate kinase n=1 Tax=Devosia sp. TaxID=1871048 RepID=UPI002DDC9FF8|nr:FGGY-family carbohydrate kinase [Devosia sp.]HEV2516479.1 FGGY-family carbohydrate kinase [Devosia sp.]